MASPATGKLTSESIFSSARIDSQVADGAQTVDMTASGSPDVVVGTAHEGDAVWHENVTGWPKHTIATGYSEVEGIDAADVDGDGNIEVFILDQGNGNVAIAEQDTGDPTGSWSTTTLDSAAPNVNHSLITDVSGDGDATDLIYGYEGTQTGEGGIYWLEHTGGDVLDSTNWNEHEIVQEEGAWGLARQRVDLSGDGNVTDLVISARTLRNPGATGGVWWLEPPSDPTNSWTQHEIDMEESALHVDVGDFSGDGEITDVVAGRFDDGTGIYWYDNDSWTRHTITPSGEWYNVRVSPASETDVIGIKSLSGSDAEMQYWEAKNNTFERVATESLYKEVDRLPFADLDGDGNDEFVAVSETGIVDYWDVNR